MTVRDSLQFQKGNYPQNFSMLEIKSHVKILTIV